MLLCGLGLTQDKERNTRIVAMSVWKVAHAENLDATDGECIYICGF
jgi:hypothetical protein